jgi:hypothetical protein
MQQMEDKYERELPGRAKAEAGTVTLNPHLSQDALHDLTLYRVEGSGRDAVRVNHRQLHVGSQRLQRSEPGCQWILVDAMRGPTGLDVLALQAQSERGLQTVHITEAMIVAAARAEAARAERAEAERAEEERAEAERAEAARADAVRADAVRAEAAKAEAARAEAARAEAAKAEAARAKAARAEAARAEAARAEAAEQAAAMQEAELPSYEEIVAEDETAAAATLQAAKAAVSRVAMLIESDVAMSLLHEIAAGALRDATVERLGSEVAAGAVAAVLRRAATWRSKPKRSDEAQRRRRGKATARKRERLQADRRDGAAGGGQVLVAGPSDGETQRERELLAARLALKDRTAVLALTRKQLRRETKTAKARWQQLARRGSNAQKKLSRKLFAKQARAIAGAARREHERSRKRKQPEGEILHSSERKHQRLVGKGGGAGTLHGGRGGGSGFGRDGAGMGGGGKGKGDGGKGGAGRGGASKGSGKGLGGKGWGGKGSSGKGSSGKGKGQYGEH